MTVARASSARRDSGQVGILCLGVVVVMVVVTQQMARLGSVVVDQARTQSVADVVALAVASGAPVSAEHLARLNGMLVESVVGDESTVDVVVSHDGVVARSRASNIDLP